MASNDYHFITVWRIPATPDEITEVLADAPALARWWPSVYLTVTEVSPGDERGVGKVVDLYTKGFLPYTLRWRFTVTESDPPHGLPARGDRRFRRPRDLDARGGARPGRPARPVDHGHLRLDRAAPRKASSRTCR